MTKVSRKEDIWLVKNVSAFLLCLSCLLTAPTFILIKKIPLKFIQLFIFILLAIINKKRLHIMGAVFFLFLTVLLNLIIPQGRVLLKVASFSITEEALLEGLSKAFTLLGLLYLSKSLLSGGLPLKGKLGGLLTRTIAHFFLLMEDHHKGKSVGIFEWLDGIFIKAYDNRERLLKPYTARNTTMLGFFSICFLLGINWFLWFLSLRV